MTERKEKEAEKETEKKMLLAEAVLQEGENAANFELSRASSGTANSQSTTEGHFDTPGAGLTADAATQNDKQDGELSRGPSASEANGGTAQTEVAHNGSAPAKSAPASPAHNPSDAPKQNGNLNAQGLQSAMRKRLQPSPGVPNGSGGPVSASPTGALSMMMKGLGRSGRNLAAPPQSPTANPSSPHRSPSPLSMSRTPSATSDGGGEWVEESGGLMSRVKSIKRGLSFKRGVSVRDAKIARPEKSTQTMIDGNSVVGQSPMSSFLHEICVATGFSYGEVWIRPVIKKKGKVPGKKTLRPESSLHAGNGAMASGLNSMGMGGAVRRENSARNFDSNLLSTQGKKSLFGGMLTRKDTDMSMAVRSSRVAPIIDDEDASIGGSSKNLVGGKFFSQYNSDLTGLETSGVPSPQQNPASKSDLSPSILANRTAMIAESPEPRSPKSVVSNHHRGSVEHSATASCTGDDTWDEQAEGAANYASLLSIKSQLEAENGEGLRSGQRSPIKKVGERVGSFIKRLSSDGADLVPFQVEEEQRPQYAYSHTLKWSGYHYGLPFQFQDGSDNRQTMRDMLKNAEDKEYDKGEGFAGLAWARKDLDWHDLDMIALDDDLCGDQRIVLAKKIFGVSVGIPILDDRTSACKAVVMLYRCYEKNPAMTTDQIMQDETLKRLLTEAADMVPTVLELEEKMGQFRKLIQQNADEEEQKKQEGKTEVKETGLLPWLKAYLVKFKGADHTFPGGHGYKYACWAFLGTFLALLLISGVDDVLRANYNFRDEDLFVLIGSYGAVAVMLFAAPTSLLVQPRNILGGHFIAVVCAVSLDYLTHEDYYPIIPQWVAVALVPAVATWIMCVTGLIHPPAGACAVIYITGGDEIKNLGWLYLVIPVLVDGVVLIGLAIMINNLSSKRRYPLYW